MNFREILPNLHSVWQTGMRDKKLPAILCGSVWLLVSGKKQTQKPLNMAITPNETAGIFGSNESSRVINGVDAPAKRAAIAPRPIPVFRTIVGNNSAE